MRTHVFTGKMRLPLLIAAIAAGCSQVPATSQDGAPATPVTAEYSAEGKLATLASDRDADGKIDTWGYMDGARVVRVEVDENNDGRIDRWEYHSSGATVPGSKDANAAGAAAPGANATPLPPDKSIERIERATKRDGKVDRKEFFEGGQLMRAEEDADADGKIDKWETYTGGTLTLMAVDTSHRGTADRRIVYDADGTFLRIEADKNGTGTFTTLHQ
jgi:hypothetical protein